MESKLKSLFEYQKFENNSRLQNLIQDSLSRYEGVELSDDDLEFVNAAGMQTREKKNQI